MGNCKHINITIDTEILTRLDAYCEKYGSKRSTVIARALEAFLKEEKQDG